MPLTDVSGILSSIDNALADGSSPDAARWAPPKTAAEFTWDTEASIGSAIFANVDVFAIESLQVGQRVWIDSRPYIITTKHESADDCFHFELEPEANYRSS